jgi:hypothetical protein
MTKELSKPLLYLGLPFGGAQINKTVQGIATLKEGGSYRTNKEGERELQFPVNNKDVKTILKASVFGKYSLPEAQKYVDSGFKALNGKQTELYENTDLDFDELKDYLKYSSSQELKDDKGYVQYTDDNNNIYWYDTKNKKLYTSDYKTSSKSVDDLKKSTKKENLIEYVDNMDNLSEEDKWELYKYNIISTTENDEGKSQLTRAEQLIDKKLTTKSEYMNILEKSVKNGIEIPDQETTDKLIDNKISLNTYYNFKQDIANQKEKNKNELKKSVPLSEEAKEQKSSVSDKQKCEILQNKKYSDKDKEKIYETFVNSKDTTYQNLKSLNGKISINAYLGYKQQDIKGDDDPDSNIKGQTVSGSTKKNFLNYLSQSGLTLEEQAYLYGKRYSFNTKDDYKATADAYYNVLMNQINNAKLSEEERKSVLKSLKNVKELEDGSLVWK